MISVKINRLQDDNISIKPFFEISQNEKYDDLDFIDVISEILNYVKRNSEITLHIKGQGIYTLVELYSENDFYNCYTNVLPGLFIYFLCAFSINCAFKLHFIPHSFSQPETMLILWLAATAFFCE